MNGRRRQTHAVEGAEQDSEAHRSDASWPSGSRPCSRSRWGGPVCSRNSIGALSSDEPDDDQTALLACIRQIAQARSRTQRSPVRRQHVETSMPPLSAYGHPTFQQSPNACQKALLHGITHFARAPGAGAAAPEPRNRNPRDLATTSLALSAYLHACAWCVAAGLVLAFTIGATCKDLRPHDEQSEP